MYVPIFLRKLIPKALFSAENLQTGAIPLRYLLTGALNELFLSFEGYLTHKIH